MAATIGSMTMPLERADRFGLWACKILFVGFALASILASASAEERKANNASAWGPMFRAQVERCWHKPYGGPSRGTVPVEAAFAIRLTRDGMLAEQPVVEKPAASGYEKAYQASAVKALNACQPYKLPIEHYDEWKHFAPVFSERGRPVLSEQDKAALSEQDRKATDLFKSPNLSICRGC
jgi:hypothetical protein